MAAAQESSKVCEAFPMKSGDGPKSYAKNSTFQREAVDVAKQLIVKEIAEKLDIDILLSFQVQHLSHCRLGLLYWA
ncbi:putative S-adenosylmethionine-dependent methyltransferase [Prunus yedoensis var. nudiflora]|uniref:Putative S-adenosylmethionine-dependent methyltransferase n=1 Tax=Prunus yedoensis var. nudiflora TaxID=2094558 RepID=A0A314Z875_PRUYE|nr:putative S-adenosylmethionine-dependent methyltransferase [Prunus yedoensis var. nudiflora]